MDTTAIRYIFAFLTFVSLCQPSALAQTTERVSVDSGGLQANSNSDFPSISSDGRYVAFQSDSSNLVPGDTNLSRDIFVHDRQMGQTTLVSVSSGGLQGNSSSYDPSISPDGRFVAFESYASNLVTGDTNGWRDIFVHDRQTGQTTRVSVDSGGLQGNNASQYSGISYNGRFVSFYSWASNLVPGDTNGFQDAFVHDRQTGQTTRVSVDSGGLQGNGYSGDPSISFDGRFVAVWSNASNLAPGDTNGRQDIFVHNRQTGQTTRVSLDSGGLQGNGDSQYPSISSDGRFVAFESSASNLVPGDTSGWRDIFVHDRQTGQTTRVSVDSGGLPGNQHSGRPSISSDGRFVAFYSAASNFGVGDTNGEFDIFVHDRQTGHTTRVSVDSGGVQGNGYCARPNVSPDGRFVAFYSEASNLVSGDTNNVPDVFVHAVDPLSPPGNYSWLRNPANGHYYALTAPLAGWSSAAIVADSLGADVELVTIRNQQENDWLHSSFQIAGLPREGAWIGFNDVAVEGTWVWRSGEPVTFTAWAPGEPNNTGGREDHGHFWNDPFARWNDAYELQTPDMPAILEWTPPVGLSLAKSGTCPGPVVLTLAGASSNGLIGVLYGPAGTFTKSGSPCAGLTVGIASPTLGALIPADAAGFATLRFNAPSGACGRRVQGVDITSCSASNLIVL